MGTEASVSPMTSTKFSCRRQMIASHKTVGYYILFAFVLFASGLRWTHGGNSDYFRKHILAGLKICHKSRVTRLFPKKRVCGATVAVTNK